MTTAILDFDAILGADAIREDMGAAVYEHVDLGLICLKYITDAFEAKHAEFDAQKSKGADPEDRGEYLATHFSWVPNEERWTYLEASSSNRRSARSSTMRGMHREGSVRTLRKWARPDRFDIDKIGQWQVTA